MHSRQSGFFLANSEFSQTVRDTDTSGNTAPSSIRFAGGERDHYLSWLWTQPLWLDLGDLRMVHARWHAESIAVLANELGANRFADIRQLVCASKEGDPLYVAVETILKGPRSA